MQSMLPRGAQCPGLALNDRQTMLPITDDAPRLTTESFNTPFMRADHIPLGDTYQPVGVDAQAHRPPHARQNRHIQASPDRRALLCRSTFLA